MGAQSRVEAEVAALGIRHVRGSTPSTMRVMTNAENKPGCSCSARTVRQAEASTHPEKLIERP